MNALSQSYRWGIDLQNGKKPYTMLSIINNSIKKTAVTKLGELFAKIKITLFFPLSFYHKRQELNPFKHMDITRCSVLKQVWLYSLQLKMEKLYTVSKNKTGSWLWLRSSAPHCKIQAQIKRWEKPQIYLSMTEIKSFMIIQWRWWIDSRDRQSAWKTMARNL